MQQDAGPGAMEIVKQPMDEQKRKTARFRISERDYFRAILLHARPTWHMWTVWILSMVLIIWSIANIFEHSSVAGAKTAGFFGLLIIVLVPGGLALLYFRSGYNYWRTRLFRSEIEIAVGDDGIRFTSPNVNSRLEWDKFVKWRCNVDYVLIYIAPTVPIIVPCAVAMQGFDIVGLKDQLVRHVGRPR